MKVHNGIIVGAAGALLAFAGVASAAPEFRNLGHGWQVFIPDADVVDIVVDEAASNSSQLVIEKFATFMSLSALDLVFTQIAPNAQTATRIILTDEYIANRTGINWSVFTNSLIAQSDGSAAWNPVASGGLSINPFTTTAYSSGNTVLEFGGGTVIDMAFWFPGVSMGALVMNVTLNPLDTPNARTSITLRETPTAVPTPGATVLALCAGGLLVARRRR